MLSLSLQRCMECRVGPSCHAIGRPDFSLELPHKSSASSMIFPRTAPGMYQVENSLRRLVPQWQAAIRPQIVCCEETGPTLKGCRRTCPLVVENYRLDLKLHKIFCCSMSRRATLAALTDTDSSPTGASTELRVLDVHKVLVV